MQLQSLSDWLNTLVCSPLGCLKKKYRKQGKERAALPDQTTPRTVPRGRFSNQAGCPKKGAQTAFISQDECK